MNKKAFTLVELIVVITILAILGTIAFISLQGYSKNARDSVRTTDLSNIAKQLQLMLVKAGKVYIPENKVDIIASGTVILYQGEMGLDTLSKLRVYNGGIDPVDKSPYTYSVTKNLNKYELMGFLENGNQVAYNNQSPHSISPKGREVATIFPQANASTNLINRFPVVKGDSIGIFLNPTTNEPINSTGVGVDIVNTNTTYKIYLDNSSSGSITGTGNTLKINLSHVINPIGSCNDILKNGRSKGNGIYKINPTGTGSFKVYCDMIGGGYTGLFSVNPKGTTWRFDSTEWTNPTLRGSRFIGEETTYNSYKYMKTNKIKICRGNLKQCYTMTPNSNRTLLSYYTLGDSYIDFSRCDNTIGTYCNGGALPNNVGVDNVDLFFSSLGINYTRNIGFTKYGAGINIYMWNRLGYQADNNNIWPNFDNVGFGIGIFASYPSPSICINTPPFNSAIAGSVALTLPNTCYYIDKDSVMWYVLGK